MSCGLYYSSLGGLQVSSLSSFPVYEYCYRGSESANNGRYAETLLSLDDCVYACGDGEDTNNESENHPQALVSAVGCNNLGF